MIYAWPVFVLQPNLQAIFPNQGKVTLIVGLDQILWVQTILVYIQHKPATTSDSALGQRESI